MSPGRVVRLVGVVAAVGVLAGASPAAAPPGATARCRDGTYSFSQHHAGTCSSHGGVAAWLGGPARSAPGSVDVGRTVLLGRRTKTGGCTLGAEPDRGCSPGAYSSKLVRAVICAASFRTGPIRNVPISEKHAVELEYGLAPRGYGRTLEIDHIVSLELGGSNGIANLYPEEAHFADGSPGFHVKDRLENRVHDLVCAGRISLRAAQLQIASDWEQLYTKIYGAAPTG